MDNEKLKDVLKWVDIASYYASGKGHMKCKICHEIKPKHIDTCPVLHAQQILKDLV